MGEAQSDSDGLKASALWKLTLGVMMFNMVMFDSSQIKDFKHLRVYVLIRRVAVALPNFPLLGGLSL